MIKPTLVIPPLISPDKEIFDQILRLINIGKGYAIDINELDPKDFKLELDRLRFLDSSNDFYPCLYYKVEGQRLTELILFYFYYDENESSWHQTDPPVENPLSTTTIISESLHQLPELQKLYLIQCYLDEIPSQFKNFRQLRELHLTYNNCDILDFSRLPNLIFLDLEHNDLQTISFQSRDLPTLQILSLGFNELTEIPESITHLENLEILLVNGNKISRIPACVNHLNKLKSFDVSDNKVTSFPSELRNPTLQELYFSGNHLTSLEGLHEYPQLQVLSLGNNQLYSLDGLKEYPQLRILGLFGNRLTSIDGLKEYPRLENLGLFNNQLTSLIGLKGYPQLQVLDLSSNRIDSLTELKDYPRLFSLLLSKNQISSLNGLRDYPQLRELWLNDNLLPSIEGMPNYPQLEFLRLENNQLTSLEGMPELPKIQELYSKNEPMTDINGKKQPRLRLLGLRGNPISTLKGVSPIFLKLIAEYYGGIYVPFNLDHIRNKIFNLSDEEAALVRRCHSNANECDSLIQYCKE